VSRAALNQTLVEAAEALPSLRVLFGRRVAHVDLDQGTVHLEDGVQIQGEVVIGADGAFSAVRAPMQKLDRFDYSQEYLDHGYKELSIPASPGGAFALEKEALHIWPRGGYMMIALPNRDGSFTCTLFFPHRGPRSFESLRRPTDVESFFQEVFPDAVPLMPTLAQDFFDNPTGSLVTVRCRPWHAGRTVLLGDAAHAVVPFYGQGANAAFEDCVVLDACLKQHAPDWPRAFAEFEKSRKPNADALADLAVANFFEMRDHVASRAFLARKKMEKALHRLFPRWYLPLYSMVSFSRIPYAEAVRRAKRQDRVVQWVATVLLVAALVGLLWGLA
jgi:kynurenine 3-monooxygenase